MLSRAADEPARARPRTVIVPAVGATRPTARFNNVVLPALLLEAALGEVGGPHPDAMAHRNPMYSQQRLAVIGEARHRGGKLASIGVLEAVGGCSGGIQGGGVPDRVDVVHDLCGLVVGELGPDVGQAVEPAADAHRSWEHDLDGLDHPRSPVGGDRGGKAHAPLDQVPEQSRPGGLGLLVADGQVQEVLPALRVDAPRHK